MVMRISFKGDYALKTILDLALSYNKGLVKISDIAKRQDIPLKYLEQILLILKGARYVNSKRGSDGGYYLTKPPNKIFIGEIVRLMEGHTSPITCVSTSCYTKCDDEKKCPFREVWIEVKKLTNGIVYKTTFADMCEKAKKLQGKSAFTYEI